MRGVCRFGGCCLIAWQTLGGQRRTNRRRLRRYTHYVQYTCIGAGQGDCLSLQFLEVWVKLKEGLAFVDCDLVSKLFAKAQAEEGLTRSRLSQASHSHQRLPSGQCSPLQPSPSSCLSVSCPTTSTHLQSL